MKVFMKNLLYFKYLLFKSNKLTRGKTLKTNNKSLNLRQIVYFKSFDAKNSFIKITYNFKEPKSYLSSFPPSMIVAVKELRNFSSVSLKNNNKLNNEEKISNP